MLTDEQRALRRTCLGSSDMAAVLGLSKWKTPEDIRLIKSGLVEDDARQSDAAEAGTLFEQGVVSWATGILGPVEYDPRVEHPDPDVPLAANLDARVIGTGVPLEVKTAGLFGPLSDEWGDHGTDEVPELYTVQCHVHMACTGSDHCWLAAFLGGRGFAMYRIPRSEELVEVIEAEAARFWSEHVIGGVPCEEAPSIDVLKRRRRVECEAPVPRELVEAWLDSEEEAKAAAKAAETAKARLLAALGGADRSAPIPGLGTLTYREQSRRGDVDWKTLALDHPEIDLEHYRKPPTTFRVARFKAAKTR